MTDMSTAVAQTNGAGVGAAILMAKRSAARGLLALRLAPPKSRPRTSFASL